MAQPPAIPPNPNPLRHPLRWLLSWLRLRWRQPNPHTESKLHRACRDFARHFRGLRVQFPVFYLLGGIGAVAGGIITGGEHLDPLAIGEWSVVGLIGPPAIVCLMIFLALRSRAPTKQRDEARQALSDKDNEIAALTATIRSLREGQEEESRAAGPRQQFTIGTVERLELHVEGTELLAAQLIDRFEVGERTAASEPRREPQPQLELPPEEPAGPGDS